jgi:hypothetical protein
MSDFLEEIVIMVILFMVEWFAIWVGLYGLNNLFPNLITITFIHILDIWLILTAIGVCINSTTRNKK